jgi:hypothetical protein
VERYETLPRHAAEELCVATIYWLISVDNPTAPALEISARLRSQLVYFMTPPEAPQVPPLHANEYWIDAAQTAQWLADGVLEVVSPLDDEHRTTVELSEEQETFLEWLATHRVQHIRLQECP